MSEVPSATSLSDRYRSLFVIGRGGMGTVEVALDRSAESFERIVALKRLLPEAAGDRRHTDMFLREARLAALLNHPNVVHAFDFGALRGELFLAMEYVEGEPLSSVVRRVHEREGALAPALAAYILAEVCDGLHAAHELCDVNGAALNVVHRDVSPHNVVVSYEGHVKLLDFGVAKIEDDRGVTRTGEVKGKTSYMSPEQAMGDALDRRSDLYSIGSVLYECIAGDKMWGEGTDIEIIRRLALESPPRLESTVPTAPRALCELHARLVAQDRTLRPPTARAVSDELRAFVAQTGTRPDARVLRAVMARLFPGAEEARKKELAVAMAAAKRGAPLHPHASAVAADAPTRISTPAVVTPPALLVEIPTRARGPQRMRKLVALVALGATGLGAAGMAAIAAGPKDSLTVGPSPLAALPSVASASAVAPAPAGQAATTPPAPSQVFPAAPSARAVTAQPAKPEPKRPRPKDTPPPAAAASGAKPLLQHDDVDPNPLAK